jgi:hypothetical protein
MSFKWLLGSGKLQNAGRDQINILTAPFGAIFFSKRQERRLTQERGDVMNDELMTRRNFLHLGLAVAALPADGKSAPDTPLLPTIPLGGYRVTRLILGSNPFNGFSYAIPSLDQPMREWSTPERIASVLGRCLECGINTWQFSYYPRSLEGLKIHQAAGGRIQWLLLTGGAMRENPGLIAEVARLKPMAIVHHGGVTDERYRAGQMDKVRDYLKAIRDSGVMVGLSTHMPAVVEHVEERGWDVDFYMTCFYQFGRTNEELRKMLGELPLGNVFLEGDPPRMCRVIRQTQKPCLAFKILAVGRKAGSPEQLEGAFRFAFSNIKAKDAVITGMYPRFKDEVAENAGIVRQICTE